MEPLSPRSSESGWSISTIKPSPSTPKVDPDTPMACMTPSGSSMSIVSDGRSPMSLVTRSPTSMGTIEEAPQSLMQSIIASTPTVPTHYGSGVMQHAGAFQMTWPTFITTMIRTLAAAAQNFSLRGQHAAAAEAWYTVAFWNTTYQRDHIVSTMALENVCRALCAQGMDNSLPDVERLLQMVLVRYRYANDEKRELEILEMLAAVVYRQGRSEEADLLRAQLGGQQSPAVEHPSMALQSMETLCEHLYGQGQYENAAMVMRHVLGEGDPQIPETLWSLAQRRTYRGDKSQETETMWRAVLTSMCTLGYDVDQNQWGLLARVRLSETMDRPGELSVSKERWETLVVMLEEVFGEEHQETCDARSRLSQIHKQSEMLF